MHPADRIEQHLGCALLPDLRALYHTSDGERDPDEGGSDLPTTQGRPMRLMSSQAVVEIFDAYGRACDLRHSAGFWEGYNSTYAFAYLAGPLKGRVYLWDYDGRHTSIAYRSVQSFLDAMNDVAGRDLDWHEMPTDYFIDTENSACRSASSSDLASDLMARRQLMEEYRLASIRDELDHHHYSINIMALTPPDRTDDILEFLHSEDMWIQAFACGILGNRRHEPAIDELVTVARKGTYNGQSAARWALKKIDTPQARKWLQELE